MRYQIEHTTTYTYDRSVTLSPHVIRLRPRCDITQALHQFSLDIHPTPSQISENLELDGNSMIKVWFPEEETHTLKVHLSCLVETFRSNPFAYLLEPWAVQLPIDYPTSLAAQLQPYLTDSANHFPPLDPIAIQLAQEIWQSTGGNITAFLWDLNQQIFNSCKHMIRETGDPFPPGMTWKGKAGSCRDFTVLFMEVCRAVGLATRFVSGYQEGDPDWEHRHLHAWAEVYLPGAGWRGYDPTQGLAVGDRHIALVASPSYRQAAPISGSLKTGVGAQSDMRYRLAIDLLD